MSNIPPKAPVTDVLSGVLVRYATAYLLSPVPLETDEVIATGDFTVRYGVRLLDKPGVAVVPGLLALDYGEMLTGEDMWAFLQARYNQYPRADVLGWRNNGEEEMIPVKKLDFAQPFMVLVYVDDDTFQPLAAVHALIAPPGYELPARLVDTLPTYPTIKEWIHRE